MGVGWEGGREIGGRVRDWREGEREGKEVGWERREIPG